MVKEPWSARQQRQLAFVSEFTTDIQHVAGKDNVVADCLSWSIVDAVNLGVDYGQMAADQASDPEVQALRAATTGLQLQEGDAWFDTLPWVLLGLRTAPKADLGASSAELVYGQPLHAPGEFLPSCSVPWSATRQLPVLRDGLKSFSPCASRHITGCPLPRSSRFGSRNPAPDLNPDPGDSPKTDSGMGPDPSGAAGKKLGRFGRVIQTPRRFCCHSKFWGGLCSEHWGERGRIPCGNTPTFSDSPDR
ncbi:hypothetical protein AAFF_G00248750 [Aldrovandia affinis]|uniref:Uncharacterized protein n=1 Tax=Aldrovandia affinis TaxID=143900 RepID=A0AAD7W3B7_9TELE|nr:hypothetical protein AAFF_G00248750 [Aldrovandia affinis]